MNKQAKEKKESIYSIVYSDTRYYKPLVKVPI